MVIMDIDETKLRRLDFTLLLIFHHLLKLRKSTEVAEQLGLSQSAISHALARLRDIFDDQLFIRLPDGLKPNSTSLSLEPHVNTLIALAADIMGRNSRFEPATSARLFRIGTIDFVSALLTPLLLEHFAQYAPNAQFTMRFISGSTALDAARSGSVDLLVGRYDTLPPDFSGQHLSDEGYSVVSRHNHALLRNGITLDGYLAADHMLVSFSGDLHGSADQALSRLGKTRRVVASVPSFLTALATAGESDVITTVPARLARQYRNAFNLDTFETPFPISPFQLSVVSHRGTDTDHGLKWLKSAIREMWPGEEVPVVKEPAKPPL
jgi:DNA-binding transcriptional LysR family regulator